jgi:uncharacterized protein YqhQ
LERSAQFFSKARFYYFSQRKQYLNERTDFIQKLVNVPEARQEVSFDAPFFGVVVIYLGYFIFENIGEFTTNLFSGILRNRILQSFVELVLA